MKAQSLINFTTYNRADAVPVIVPRTDSRPEIHSELRNEDSLASRTMPFSLQSKNIELRKLSSGRDDLQLPTISPQSETAGSNSHRHNSLSCRKAFATFKGQQDQGLAENSSNDNWPPVIIKTNRTDVIEPPAVFPSESCMYFVDLYITFFVLSF